MEVRDVEPNEEEYISDSILNTPTHHEYDTEMKNKKSMTNNKEPFGDSTDEIIKIINEKNGKKNGM